MILLTLALLGFGVADLLRLSSEPIPMWHGICAALGGAVASATVAGLAGFAVLPVGIVAVGTALSVGLWLILCQWAPHGKRFPALPLVWVLVVLMATFAASGAVGSAAGELKAWYHGLSFPFVTRVPLGQFLLAAAVAVFLISSANQIVRLVLDASGTPAARGESALKGGRVLGPMERLFVAAMVVSGAVAAGAALIAAKGLLRFPEIRSDAEQGAGQTDQITEYFLIGTFSSLLLAATLGAVILAAG